MKMKLKKAIEICKSINSDNISDDDKFEAIKIVINSQHNSMLLSKPFFDGYNQILQCSIRRAQATSLTD